MSRGRRISVRDDRGVILILAAVAMVAIVFTVAIIIDLGATRSFRRDTRLASDAGSTSGALSLVTSSLTACQDAFAYTFADLGGTQPTSSAITSACTAASMSTTCTDATAARTATLTSGGSTVKVTNPVPDGSSLLNADAVGGGSTQSGNATVDGTKCNRLAVQVTRAQQRFFGPGSSTYTVHSVARYSPSLRKGQVPPALVALNTSTCNAIDAGTNGNIVLVANSSGPGIAYSDSNGPGCSGTSAILASRSSARMVAESTGSVAGELAWFQAASSAGYNSGGSVYSQAPASFAVNTQNYVGRLYARTERVTRQPADEKYHCMNVSPTPSGCTTATDAIATLQALAASGTTTAPPGYSTYAGPCTTASSPPAMSGNVWVNCATFTVKGATLSIAGGSSVVFKGALAVEAGGILRVNTSGTFDASGYPVATDSTKQTTLVVNSTAATAISFTTNSSAVQMAQTSLYSRGGLHIQPSQQVRWTPPTSGLTKGLLYWSESNQPFNIQGSPVLKAKGVFFQGNGALTAGGGGTIDLSNVQMWMDTASVSGGGSTLKLAADPETAITVTASGSALIR